MKIIHLSDLHVGYKEGGKRTEIIFNSIVNREDPKNTVIIITGDLTENGSKEEERQKVFKFLKVLKAASFPVLICPGNHDYGSGLINEKHAAEKFHENFLPDRGGFPLVDIINDITFIGIDSNHEELHWYDRFFADGEIGKAQLDKVKEIIDKYPDKTKVLYLHHHPVELIPLHKLKDAKKLKEVVKNKVDVILYGHNHLGNNYSGRWGTKVMLDGGSSTGKRNFGRKIFHRIINLDDFSVRKVNYLES
jgi:3',5'-cyclic AMP phosphodiesterase CpdA